MHRHRDLGSRLGSALAIVLALALPATGQQPYAPPSSGAASDADGGVSDPPWTAAAPSPPSPDLEARLQALEWELARQRAETDSLRRQIESAAGDQGASSESSVYMIGSQLEMSASWKNGLLIETKNKDFTFRAGGRTQLDGVWFGDSPAFAGTGGAMSQDAVDLRRGRLRMEGTFYQQYEWCVEYDFTNTVNDNAGIQPATESNVTNTVVPTDAWWTVHDLPLVGNLRIGNQKEPIGLEHLTSSRYLDFLERSFNQDAFTGPFNNGFTPGVTLHKVPEGEWGTATLGVFKNTPNPFAFGTGDNEYAITGRLTWTPWYDEPTDGRYLLHLGVAGSWRDNNNQQLRIRSRPSLRNGPGSINPVLVDTGLFDTQRQYLVGLEAAAVAGPLLIQSEYIISLATDAVQDGVDLGTYQAHGYYIAALWFLTGEHRHYDRRGGAFGRVEPFENAFLLRGTNGPVYGRGGWQLAARYSHLDLRDSGLDGGVVQDMTLGVNWFMNPNMKLQGNYVLTYRDAPGGTVQGFINGFGMRLAHDF